MPADIGLKNSILSADAAQRRIRRMAFQIAEQNTGEQELLVLGVEGNGSILALQIAEELRTIGLRGVQTGIITLNKRSPQDARIEGSFAIDDRVVLVVDDVSNTGRTLLYALQPLLSFLPRKIQTLVLVERAHKLFAVQPDFVGLTVSTTLQEHITVETDGGRITGAFLH